MLKRSLVTIVHIAGRFTRARLVAGLGLAAGALLALAPPSQAQDTVAGARVWAEANCSACHGNLATGGEDPSYPAGPNLRRTRLDHDQLVEVIGCGRPNTMMPSHLTGAYTEHACYGQPAGPVPADITAAGFLSEDEITNLVAFLEGHVVGETRVTRENCALFYGGDLNAVGCREFP
jgi:mono/diheme cytochrome c family protein